ncbi:MAG: HEAT repeat domain-containing protein [Limisphaerales bacterium]
MAQLKTALNHDPFFGVRVEAAAALASIHSDESLEALLASTGQSDARARRAVAGALAGFYNPAAYDAETKALAAEKNPDIEEEDIRGLANYDKPEVRALLLPLLNSHSYRNSRADSAIAAMRVQDDVSYLPAIRQALDQRRDDFTTGGINTALGAIGFLARHEDQKDDVRQFLVNYVNSNNRQIRRGAIRALGELQDPRAIPLLETFATAGKKNPEQAAAAAALQAIRAARQPADNLKELRDTVLDLQKENRQLRKDLDALQKKVDAKAGSRSSKSR